jgi:hypothetical protein
MSDPARLVTAEEIFNYPDPKRYELVRGWLVDPRDRRVIVRYPDRPPRVLTDRDVLDGEDVVPGFALCPWS